MARAKARGQDRARRVGGTARPVLPEQSERGTGGGGRKGGQVVQGRVKLGREFRFYSKVLNKTTGGFK